MTLPRRAEAPPSGIPSWCRVGAKVVAIGVDKAILRLPPNGVVCPKKGSIYTIRAVKQVRGEVGIYLVELVNAPLPSGWEPAWLIRGFRPLVIDSEELGIETVLYRQKGRKSKAPVRENERA